MSADKSEEYKKLREAVGALYYAAYWKPDRNCDATRLWLAVREAAGFERGESFKRLGLPQWEERFTESASSQTKSAD